MTDKFTIDALDLHAGESPAQGLGPNTVMHTWFQLFRTAEIHSLDNQALQRPIEAMVELAAAMVPRDGRISFQIKDRSLFVNATKLRLSNDEFALAKDVFNFFEQRELGGFVIDAALTAEAVRTILNIVVYAPPSDRTYAAIDAALKAAGIPFKVNKSLGGGPKTEAEVKLERRGYTFLTYSKLVVLFRSLIAEQNPSITRRMFLRKKISRTVQALVDICVEDDHTFLGAASVKNGEAYDPHHATNTAVLAIALGEKLGLSKVELSDLGLAAVFHDVGIRGCAPEVIAKQGLLNTRERSLVEQHPIASVEHLLTERHFNKSVLSRIVVAFEHHRHFDGGGYPRGTRTPDLFARIVAIGDVYDALTTQRPWRPAFLPDEALAMMMRESGKQFDPVLLKVFVNTVGLYPVGTLVRLDTGELGVVVYSGGDAERVSRPVVALLGADGKTRATVDLAEKSDAGYRRSIVHSEDPEKYGLQTSGFVANNAGVAA